MSSVEGFASGIQAVVVLLIMAFFLNEFISAMPGDLLSGPFSDTLFFISNLPWILVVMGVLVLLTMIAEVVGE
ncbi:hypothetical protein [Halobaculum sp. EA56]|uniref:hypothetical protein n=1 Tax=Halobaculum sp. EA56 TaxID=3421648 RepID=UPI003EB79A43